MGQWLVDQSAWGRKLGSEAGFATGRLLALGGDLTWVGSRSFSINLWQGQWGLGDLDPKPSET